MTRRRTWWTLAAALALGACGEGSMGARPGPATPPDVEGAADPDALWMDDAEVVVTEDACRGVVTVELVNAAVGHAEVMDREISSPDPSRCTAA
jgi:hypothetical protein